MSRMGGNMFALTRNPSTNTAQTLYTTQTLTTSNANTVLRQRNEGGPQEPMAMPMLPPQEDKI